jgi:hypothetical protein
MDPHHELHEELQRLERLWIEQGAPIAGILAPGVPPEAALEALRDLDVIPPASALAVWSWHNGTTRPGFPGQHHDELTGISNWCLESAEQSAQRYRELRAEYGEPDPYGEMMHWQRSWIPVLQGLLKPDYAFLSADDDWSPVYAIVNHEWESGELPRATSLVEAISVWARVLEVGAHYYADGIWHYAHDRMPEEFRLNPLYS